MSLSRKLIAALDATPDLDPLPGPVALAVEDGGHRLRLDLIASGPVGLAFDALSYSAAPAPDLSTEALRAWADRLAGRVTYLMEPLVVVELDPVAGEAELRSHAPTPRGEVKSFYEVHLNRSGHLDLSRVIFDDLSRRRRPAPCQLTREVLERLLDDLVACSR